ncbi:MAG: hypothetical protein DI551_11710, partial [Micavibrio aeruginosavorus]
MVFLPYPYKPPYVCSMQSGKLKTHLKTDIVISGAGPAGLTLSALLGLAGFDVVLVDAEAPKPQAANAPLSGRTAALLNGSVNVLKAAGVWDAVKDISTPLKIMKIVDDNHASAALRASVEFRAGDIGEPQFGYNIPNNDLRAALLARIGKIKAVTHLAPAKLVDYTADASGVAAVTEDGTQIQARLIIGTDGRQSIVRKAAGIDAKIHDYDQRAITCLIEHSKSHNFTSTEFRRAGGPFTFVPMPGNQSSIVWVEKTADAQKYLAMKRDEFEKALQDRTNGYVGNVK